MIRGIALALLLQLLIGCSASDEGHGWKQLATEPSALLGVWGSSETDVWVTGARATIDGAPVLLHYDGSAWTRVASGQTGIDLWSVFGVGTTRFFGGSNGVILRTHAGDDPASIEVMQTPASGLVFGLWGPAENDVWAVGATDDGGGFAWHFDGTAWTARTLPAGVSGRVFKVHGRASDDVWICAAGGITLHWTGTALERVATPVTSSLFSIVATPARVIAVGGEDLDGALVETTGVDWERQPLAAPFAWRGVAALGDTAYAVGEHGIVAVRGDAGWSPVSQKLVQGNFHAAWLDPRGGLWAVGGDFDRVPLKPDGFMTYYGDDRPEALR